MKIEILVIMRQLQEPMKNCEWETYFCGLLYVTVTVSEVT